LLDTSGKSTAAPRRPAEHAHAPGFSILVYAGER